MQEKRKLNKYFDILKNRKNRKIKEKLEWEKKVEKYDKEARERREYIESAPDYFEIYSAINYENVKYSRKEKDESIETIISCLSDNDSNKDYPLIGFFDIIKEISEDELYEAFSCEPLYANPYVFWKIENVTFDIPLEYRNYRSKEKLNSHFVRGYLTLYFHVKNIIENTNGHVADPDIYLLVNTRIISNKDKTKFYQVSCITKPPKCKSFVDNMKLLSSDFENYTDAFGNVIKFKKN